MTKKEADIIKKRMEKYEKLKSFISDIERLKRDKSTNIIEFLDGRSGKINSIIDIPEKYEDIIRNGIINLFLSLKEDVEYDMRSI